MGQILSGILIFSVILFLLSVNIEHIEDGYTIYFTINGIRKEIIIKTKWLILKRKLKNGY